MLHKGAVNSLKVVDDRNLLLSCSADGSISVLSLPDFKQVLTMNAKDMVFFVEEVFDTIIASTAKGNILSYDLFSGFGSCQLAVRHQSAQAGAVLVYLHSTALEHLEDVILIDLVEGESLLGRHPGEDFSIKFVVRSVKVQAGVECLEDRLIVDPLVFGHWSHELELYQ
ncbi:unnamed protein product [Sphagnum balticum]